MKLLAFDLETTGLNPRTDQILQIGAVAFDHEDVTTPVEELPHFVTDVRHDRYEGDAYALQMNAAILKRISDGGRAVPSLRQAIGNYYSGGRDRTTLIDFIQEQFPGDDYKRGPHPVGFNVAAFDVAFVKAAGYDLFHYRPIDLGSLLSTDGLPVSSTNALNIIGREVTHDALEDARDAVRLYRYWKASR
jgi:oligoribonuclease (3'-5' exoribonuclease)